MSKFAYVNRFWFSFVAIFCLLGSKPSGATLITPLLPSDFDDSKGQMWVQGTVSAPPTSGFQLFVTQSTRRSTDLVFANTGPAGPRHLRYAFVRPIPIGSVAVLGNAEPYLLKATAVYPGDIVNENDWVRGQRVAGAQVDPAMPPSASDVVVWIFPEVVNTRAIRFSRTSLEADSNPGGRLVGVYVYSERLNNVAAQAQIFASSGQSTAPFLNNYRFDGTWVNAANGAATVISPATPERLVMVWPEPVTLAGFGTFAAGFSEGLVQKYIGSEEANPRYAEDAAWETVKVFTNLRNHSNVGMSIDHIDFLTPQSSRAFRVVITKAADPAIETHLGSSTVGGKKVFATELMAMYALGTEPVSASIVARGCDLPPPIAIPFHLEEAGYVTLVIEDTNGKRVRNLTAETFFAAGDNTVFWDGLDESGRIDSGLDQAYTVQGALVAPGVYRARGLVRGGLELRYEFTVNNAGSPAWQSSNFAGGWLSDHRPASDVAYLPAKNELLFVAEVGEASNAGIYANLEGEKTGALGPFEEGFFVSSHLAQDFAPTAAANIATYSLVYGASRVYLHTIDTNRNRAQLSNIKNWNVQKLMGGLAVWNGAAYFSMPDSNVIHQINIAGKAIGASVAAPNPRGITFDAAGRLLVLSGTSLVRYTVQASPFALTAPEVLISAGLEDPKRITVHRATGNLYISDWGNNNQVKVFDGTGAFIRAIGKPGPLGIGLYDPLHMNRPHGTAVTPDGHVWVAEYDMSPKRISKWTLDGTLADAFYGPPKYGGGGRLDSTDKTRFYYADRDIDDPIPFHVGMEWRLDWATGSNYLHSVYSRWGTNVTADTFEVYPPETAVHLNGRHYMVNTYNGNDVSGTTTLVGIWEMADHVAKPVAAFGGAATWAILGKAPFTNGFPASFNRLTQLFLWSDLNGDYTAQPNEISYRPNSVFTSYQANTNLDFITAHGLRVLRTGFAPTGAPLYDLASATNLPNIGSIQFTSGGGEMLEGENGWHVLTGGPMKGFRDGQLMWTYPSQWPGLHASHQAPPFNPNPPGLLVGTMRVLGAPFTPVSGEAGQVWGINGNRGDLYLMTTDGLFVGRLFKSFLEAGVWSMPTLPRNALINEVSQAEEPLWPSMTQTSDGNVYLVAGKSHSSVVRVDGLSSVKRFQAPDFTVTTDQLRAAVTYLQDVQACKVVNAENILVGLSPFAPTVDSTLNEWPLTNFISIDGKATGAVMIAQGKLYAAWMTESATTATNSFARPDELFKTGGGLDLMIGTDPGAADGRKNAVAGDLRLLVTKQGLVTRAMLYRQVAPPGGRSVPFTSPVRTLTMDDVQDVSADVQLVGFNGRYEMSIPLARLGLNPIAGTSLRGDIGVLRGVDGVTLQRSYAFNKATGIVSDTPTEAELTPQLWGRWEFKAIPAREAWRATKFGSGATAESMADGADPDGDGLSNIVEYALGLDPMVANTPAQRPKPEVRTIDGKRYLTLTFSQSEAANDVLTRIEASDAIGTTWSASIVEVSRTGGDVKTVTVRDTVPLDAAAQRFLRLNVVSP